MLEIFSRRMRKEPTLISTGGQKNKTNFLRFSSAAVKTLGKHDLAAQQKRKKGSAVYIYTHKEIVSR